MAYGTSRVEAATAPLILVVDDNDDLRELLAMALGERGYRVALAENGSTALDAIVREKPALILLDMRMPVMDGWAFVREFRERYSRSIPILVMTAAQDARLRTEEVGADAYLGKPFELEDLYRAVEDAVLD